MNTILIRLGAFTFLTLFGAFGAGWYAWADNPTRGGQGTGFLLHFFLGLFAVLVCLAVHCLVFIYFLGTGRWVKEVAIAYRIADEPHPKLTRELKRKSYPAALFAMLSSIAAAAAGAGAQMGQWHWTVHATLATLTLLINAWAFMVEYRCIQANIAVLDAVMVEVEQIRFAAGLPTNAEALKLEEEAGTRS